MQIRKSFVYCAIKSLVSLQSLTVMVSPKSFFPEHITASECEEAEAMQRTFSTDSLWGELETCKNFILSLRESREAALADYKNLSGLWTGHNGIVDWYAQPWANALARDNHSDEWFTLCWEGRVRNTSGMALEEARKGFDAVQDYCKKHRRSAKAWVSDNSHLF